jgi:hypothetical protein
MANETKVWALLINLAMFLYLQILVKLYRNNN